MRSLRRQPGLVVATVLVLALGMGLSTAVFTVLNAVVLRPLPFPDADQLVHVHRDQPPVRGGPISRPDFLDMETASDRDMRIAGFHWDVATLLGTGRAERVASARVSEGFFALMGMPALHGRMLVPADGAADAPLAVVIGEQLWERRYARDPGVVGSTIRLGGGERATVVGISPRAMEFPGTTELWLPARYASDPTPRGSNYVQVMARLAPGTGLESAQARMSVAAQRLARDWPEDYAGLALTVRPLLEWQVGHVRGQLWLVLCAVGLVLLVVCANVANLLLARNLSRAQELATRAALGAGRAEIVADVLRDSVLLALAGSALGLALAQAVLQPLLALAPSALPRTNDFAIDPVVVVFALGLALLCGLACGALPALLRRETGLAIALRRGSRGMLGGGERWRRALVVAELALAVVLVAGATLLDASLRRLSAVDPGFEPDGVMTARVVLPEPLPATWNGEGLPPAVAANARFLEAVLQRLDALPGVDAVAATDQLPLAGSSTVSGGVRVEGREYGDGEAPTVEFRFITPGLPAALGIPLLRGSGLPQRAGSGPVPVLANETFVEIMFPGEDPIGRRVLALGETARVIVGVVGDVRQWSLDAPTSPELYFALGSMGFHPSMASLVVRTSGSPEALTPAIEKAVAEVDRDVPVFSARTMTAQLEQSLARRDFLRTLLLAFALSAALVAAIGLYAVMAFDVAQRRGEIGVRLALGAAPARVMADTLRRGAGLAALGAASGALLAMALSRVLQAQLYEVSATALWAYALAAAVVVVLAVGACWIPARRAARVSPMQALRYE